MVADQTFTLKTAASGAVRFRSLSFFSSFSFFFDSFFLFIYPAVFLAGSSFTFSFYYSPRLFLLLLLLLLLLLFLLLSFSVARGSFSFFFALVVPFSFLFFSAIRPDVFEVGFHFFVVSLFYFFNVIDRGRLAVKKNKKE